MNMSTISDAEILTEYVRRFTIPAGESIKNTREAADNFRAFYNADAAKREQFCVCFVNGQHRVLKTETLFVGSLTTSAVYPREVIQRVLDLGAAAVLLAHNHPSSEVTPSNSDRAVTKKLQIALNAIDVELLDHIVIGGTEYFSFSDHHLL